MKTDRDFVDAVLRDPDPDEPRRAYAEWLAERGDPRGDFTRVQLELARLRRAGATVATWAPLVDSQDAYLARFRPLWLTPLEDLMARGLIADPRFLRGFVEVVTMDARTFLLRAPEVYAVAPIRHVDLTNVRDAPAVLESPHLERIVSLSLSANRVTSADVARLAASPHARRLAWLDLSSNDIDAKGLDAIAGSPHLRGLAYVNFVGNDAPDPAEQIGVEDGAMIDASDSAEGIELERRFGPLPWLHAPSRWRDAWPPHREAPEPPA